MSVLRILNMPITVAGGLLVAKYRGPTFTGKISSQTRELTTVQDLAILAGISTHRFKEKIAIELIAAFSGLAMKLDIFERGYPFAPAKEIRVKETLADFISLTNSIKSKIDVLEIFDQAMQLYDRETAFHQRRVKEICSQLGYELGMRDEWLSNLVMAANLHDVGKLGVPLKILNGKHLTEEQRWIVVRGHLEAGYLLLKQTFLSRFVGEIILYHHVFDGHPAGLKQEKAGQEAIILSLVDNFDARTNRRSYRPASEVVSPTEAIRDLRKEKKYPEKYVGALERIILRNQNGRGPSLV